MSELKNIGFDPIVIEWFESTFGKASPPQELGWPKIATGNNTLIFAPTGSGKTLAAFLWCINDIYCTLRDESSIENSAIHTLYISPLKALNNDIERNLRLPAHGIWQLARTKIPTISPLKISVRTGDTPAHIRRSMITRPPHILITTPESLYLLLTSHNGRNIFSRLKYIIVDEIHALSNNKRGVHLSLSLERLENLVKKSPVRIGLSATQNPLDRIAGFLGGQYFSPVKNEFLSRPVTIVDCGYKRHMDIKIVNPAKEFSQLPDATVWPQVINKCYDLIKMHTTTLIFVNMRAQAEKVVRKLNDLHQAKTGDSSAVIALAHHGSMSREIRFSVEEKLKKGLIPAVVATASLELGIDIGSIDLVIQLESPRSVAGSLQRIGRSGHLISSKSKGRIIPLYPGDLDDAAALTCSVLKAEIEETHIPENCLDVLAQQIIAETAMQVQKTEDLFEMIRRSYCYRNLPRQLFESVLQMLEGKYADSRLPALQAIVVWDRVNQKITAQRSARLTAILNGGTIPDRGYYSVIISGQNKRLGEVEEEFVFESRVGDIFFLGNTEWRIDNITNDRIMVTPAQSVKPRAPFWKGEIPYRSYETSIKTGQMRDTLEAKLDRSDVTSWLVNNCYMDKYSAQNLVSFLRGQKSLTGSLPTHKSIIVETFYDSANELNLIVHAPFGGRVIGLWAIAVAGILEKYFKSEVQFTFNDDGFLVRLPDTVDAVPLESILKISVTEAKSILPAAITNAPIFAIQFRYNATRALLLPRSRQGKRIPLWLQRLRSADLLQAVKKYPDFPIVLETYRTCLYDVFDLNSFLIILGQLERNEITMHRVQTPYPSPMASGLIFNFLTYQMYDYDRTRAPGEAASISTDILSQIMEHEEIPAIIDRETISEASAKWQHLTPDTRARDAEELFLIIAKLGPISERELATRCAGNFDILIDQLKSANRIKQVSEKPGGWTTAELANTWEKTGKHNLIQLLIRKYLEANGPVTGDEIAEFLNLPSDLVLETLNKLLSESLVIYAEIITDDDRKFWCDKQNFAELYRRSIAIRRKRITALSHPDYLRFLFQWHYDNFDIQKFLLRYQYFRFDPQLLESEILPGRFSIPQENSLEVSFEKFTEMFRSGEFIIRIPQESAQVMFHPRGAGNYYINDQVDDQLTAQEEQIYNFLKENGSCMLVDIEDALDMPLNKLKPILTSLVEKGLVTCDDYNALISLLKPQKILSSGPRSRLSRQQYHHMARQNVRIYSGHWFLTSAFSVLGKERTSEEKAVYQARLLLQRHGILVKEWYRRENDLISWYTIFQILKRLEWQGEIRRGYFIEGLSGVQFATHEAVQILENPQSPPEKIQIVSTLDPVFPFGGHVPWNLSTPSDTKINIVRGKGNHIVLSRSIPVAYMENFGHRIWLTPAFQPEMSEELAEELKFWLRLPARLRLRRKIEVAYVNNSPASDSMLVTGFISHGFEKDGKKLVLWPSGV